MAFRLSISSLLDALLPRSCLLCGAAAGAHLCAGCDTDLPRLAGPCCPVCALPMTTSAPICGECLRRPPAFDATLAPLRYTYPVDHLVQQLKFGHRLAGADFFAHCLLAMPAPAGDMIVPVPLSPQRLQERGFNQAVEIARTLARTLRIPLAIDSLVRARDTLPQSRLPWRARRSNVRQAFACRHDLTGKNVIVVDDVMTTGATLDAVAQVLKDHGAAHVVNWIASRAVREIT